MCIERKFVVKDKEVVVDSKDDEQVAMQDEWETITQDVLKESSHNKKGAVDESVAESDKDSRVVLEESGNVSSAYSTSVVTTSSTEWHTTNAATSLLVHNFEVLI